MTDRHCASSNQCGTVPNRIVVAVPRFGQFTGREDDRIPDIAARRPVITQSSLSPPRVKPYGCCIFSGRHCGVQ
jgi:hypothetical protein